MKRLNLELHFVIWRKKYTSGTPNSTYAARNSTVKSEIGVIWRVFSKSREIQSIQNLDDIIHTEKNQERMF